VDRENSVPVIVRPGQKSGNFELIEPPGEVVQGDRQLSGFAGVDVDDFDQLRGVGQLVAESGVRFQPLLVEGDFFENGLGRFSLVPEIWIGGFGFEVGYPFRSTV